MRKAVPFASRDRKERRTRRPGGVTTPGVHAQIQSNLGRLILKEEKEKAVRFRRKTQSLPDRTHMHTSEPEDNATILFLVLFASLWVLMHFVPRRSVCRCFEISFALQLRPDQSEFRSSISSHLLVFVAEFA